MTEGSGSRSYRRWFSLYLSFVAIVSAAYGFLSARRASGWAIGERGINYSVGFIRRGPPGEIVLRFGRSFGVRPASVVLAIQLVVFLTYLWCVYLLVKGLCWNWLVTAMLLSPATLSFIVLDPPNGFKREILLFAALALLICILLYTQIQ